LHWDSGHKWKGMHEILCQERCWIAIDLLWYINSRCLPTRTHFAAADSQAHCIHEIRIRDGLDRVVQGNCWRFSKAPPRQAHSRNSRGSYYDTRIDIRYRKRTRGVRFRTWGKNPLKWFEWMNIKCCHIMWGMYINYSLTERLYSVWLCSVRIHSVHAWDVQVHYIPSSTNMKICPYLEGAYLENMGSWERLSEKSCLW
jgi:hypothetical protein